MARKGGKDRGLFLRGKVWYIRYADANGRERKERAGTTKTAAQVLYQQRKTEAAQGVHFTPKRGCITVSEAIDRYKASAKVTDWGAADVHHEKRMRKRWGHLRVDQLSAHDLEVFMRERLKECGPSTINRDLGFWRRVIRKAIRDGVARHDATAGVAKFKVPEGRTRYLTREEEARLKKTMPACFWSFVLFAIHTGLRQGEQFTLLWRDVDLRKKVVTVVHSKASRTRHIPLNAIAMEALRALPRTYDRVFPYHALGWIDVYWRPALRAAGIKHLRWHDLRHTFGSRLAMAGVPLPQIKELMGHASIGMTMRYAHLAPSFARAGVDALVGPEHEPSHEDFE